LPALSTVVIPHNLLPFHAGVIPKARVFSSGPRDLAHTPRTLRLVNVVPSFSQILPVRIHSLNQANLLTPPPPLDLLLPRNSRVGIPNRS
jgi:hypothetical protein